MGAGEKTKGKMKEAAGALTDNERRKKEGRAAQKRAEAEEQAEEAREERERAKRSKR